VAQQSRIGTEIEIDQNPANLILVQQTHHGCSGTNRQSERPQKYGPRNTTKNKKLTDPASDTNGTATKSSNGTNKPEDGIDDQDSEDEDKETGEGPAVEGGIFHIPPLR